MRFKIQWSAIVGSYLLRFSEIEELDATNSSDALNKIRTSIITKLASLNNKFFVTNVSFINIGMPITVSPTEQFDFLNSINSEGGLAQTVPKGAPTRVNVKTDENGNMTISPIYEPPQSEIEDSL